MDKHTAVKTLNEFRKRDAFLKWSMRPMECDPTDVWEAQQFADAAIYLSENGIRPHHENLTPPD